MKFLIHTYGCQMNVRDSEAVEALLLAAGHDKLGVRLVLCLDMPGRKKQRLDRFRVADVHLAAVGMDQELHFFFSTTSVSNRAVRGNMLNQRTDSMSYPRQIVLRSRISVAGSHET